MRCKNNPSPPAAERESTKSISSAACPPSLLHKGGLDRVAKFLYRSRFGLCLALLRQAAKVRLRKRHNATFSPLRMTLVGMSSVQCFIALRVRPVSLRAFSETAQEMIYRRAFSDRSMSKIMCYNRILTIFLEHLGEWSLNACGSDCSVYVLGNEF